MQNLFLKFIKLISKRIKKHLPSLTSSNQTAYVDKKFISNGGGLMSDILEIADLLKLKGLLLTVDIEKAFDSVDDDDDDDDDDELFLWYG